MFLWKNSTQAVNPFQDLVTLKKILEINLTNSEKHFIKTNALYLILFLILLYLLYSAEMGIQQVTTPYKK